MLEAERPSQRDPRSPPNSEDSWLPSTAGSVGNSCSSDSPPDARSPSPIGSPNPPGSIGIDSREGNGSWIGCDPCVSSLLRS